MHCATPEKRLLLRLGLVPVCNGPNMNSRDRKMFGATLQILSSNGPMRLKASFKGRPVTLTTRKSSSTSSWESNFLSFILDASNLETEKLPRSENKTILETTVLQSVINHGMPKLYPRTAMKSFHLCTQYPKAGMKLPTSINDRFPLNKLFK